MSNEYTQMDRARVLGAYLGDIRVEIMKMARTPAFAIPTILFPLMFYMLFGVVMGGAGGDPQRGLYALAGYAVFGTMGPGLFGFGVSLAFEREQGLLTFRQALPAPPGGYLLGRMVNAMLFVSISAALLLALAVTAGHAPLSFGQAIQLFIVNVLGVLPFCALGLFFGTLASGNAAPAIINMVYLPMAFLSGLWVPMQFLPKLIQQMAPLWPAYHLAQLSLSAVDAPSRGSTATHLAALVGLTVLSFFIAMRRLSNRGISLLGPGMPQTRPGVAAAARLQPRPGVGGHRIVHRRCDGWQRAARSRQFRGHVGGRGGWFLTPCGDHRRATRRGRARVAGDRGVRRWQRQRQLRHRLHRQ